ncbi:MAG: Holliday junction resolvase RuvX [Marinirhabdus sp.]
MARLLAIDYGTKRTGIAVTDPLQLIASGLTTVGTHDLFRFLNDYFLTETVEKIIVGEPKQKDGTHSAVEVDILGFIKKFKKKFPSMPVERADERFTSKMAFKTMIATGVPKKKRRDKALVDKISATLILQGYLKYRA